MKKNRLIPIVVALFGVVGCLSSCGDGGEEGGETTGQFEYALVTDVGDVDDESFNQTSWEALKDFCEENGKNYNYYRPTADSTAARLVAMDQAVQRGAKVIVCPGYLFEDSVYEAQTKYPDVKFVLIDGQPHTADYSDYKTADNTVSIIFQEEIAGFLAGYAAVHDGNTKLGFCGGMAVPAVQRYGSGFIQGADYALGELGKTGELNYYYAGAFAATDAATLLMRQWYQGGTETVFASGGKVYLSVKQAADEASGDVTWIGVDVDQASISEKVLTSAIKGLRESVTSALEVYANGEWDVIGGEDYTLGLNSPFGDLEAKDYVGIPTTDSTWSRFKTFTKEQYNTILEKIKSGEVEIDNSVTEAPAFENLTVNWNSEFASAEE